ncbi:sigma-70 family RNA polymerase sigma factor [Paenarthrobacter ureafaciens]|uniref:RNA polymerase sigma factor n=1 Tax=Paenarthrobacter ureafaciens TaxID=37931 RepID=UPI0015BA464C|nr:sigma-70 family RNA polymerase sigma factor [Paenarthrobacter ureafaciens]NWL27466.1 sigma-70 family RNA polymerase sigma factor [Paenarthrobacter ureafaciens]
MGNIESQDSGLWSRSLEGDGVAFGTLFDRHRDRVFRHAYRLCADRHTSEDITATVFLELWRKRQSVVLVELSVLPWLLATTTNVARNANRSAFRYRRLINSLPRQEEASALSGEAVYLQSSLDKDVVEALQTLSTMDLQLISLVAFEGYTISAAAELLKLSPSAAKSRMHRARLKMKDVLPASRPTTAQLAMEGKRS